jgi:hypothetical protein
MNAILIGTSSVKKRKRIYTNNSKDSKISELCKELHISGKEKSQIFKKIRLKSEANEIFNTLD